MLLWKLSLVIVLMFDGLDVVNRNGSSIQHTISEQTSYCRDERCRVKIVHNTAAPADPVIGSTSLNREFHIVGPGPLQEPHESLTELEVR